MKSHFACDFFAFIKISISAIENIYYPRWRICDRLDVNKMKRGFMMTTFTIHTVESAPAEVKEVLETVKKDNNGYIPNLIGLLG